MAGLFLLAILSLWILICLLITRFIFKNTEKKYIKKIFIPIVFLLILTAPVMDEIIGGFQFRALCNKNSLLIFDEEKIKGKTVIYQRVRDNYIYQYLIPVLERNWSYKDISTGEIVISWKSYEAKGGWLSHFIGFPQGSPPYTFDGYCSSKEGFDFDFKKYGTNVHRSNSQ